MSYVHCHKCSWTQDDFWSLRGYNPLRFYLSTTLPWLAVPRLVEVGDKRTPTFSWMLLARRTLRLVRAPFKQKYWTRAACKRAEWTCPQCGGQLCED